MRKTRTMEEIILEAFEGCREGSGFLSTLNDKELLGYVVALVHRDNLSLAYSLREWYDETKRLIDSGKL